MTDGWWLPKQKQYQLGTEKWWCFRCGELAPLERNPEWDGQFKGKWPAPEWFVRCAVCHWQHFQSDGFDCPECGWTNEDDEAVAQSYGEMVNVPSTYLGPEGHQWEETWLCPICGTTFSFTNADF